MPGPGVDGSCEEEAVAGEAVAAKMYSEEEGERRRRERVVGDSIQCPSDGSNNNTATTLLQMRQRHSKCLKILQEKALNPQPDLVELEARERMQKEMQDLNQRLLTTESTDQTLVDMRQQQIQHIEQIKEEVTLAIGREMERLRECSEQDMHALKQSMEMQVDHLSTSSQNHSSQCEEESSGRIEGLQADLDDARRSQKAAETEAADLRVRLASVEERAKMLQARQEELLRERSALDDERRDLRQQSEQQWQKVIGMEQDLQRHKAEADALRAEVARLIAADADQEKLLREERVAARLREEELQQELLRLRAMGDEVRRDFEVKALRAETEHKDALRGLRLQVEHLEDEAISKESQLAQTRQSCARLEAEKAAAQQREQATRQHLLAEQDELSAARDREAELLSMLEDLQASIIQE